MQFAIVFVIGGGLHWRVFSFDREKKCEMPIQRRVPQSHNYLVLPMTIAPLTDRSSSLSTPKTW